MKDRFDPESVRVRRAEGAERRACRMLLQGGPEGLGHVDELLIATTAEPSPRVLGALSLVSLRDAAGAGALLVAARVVGPWRRRGIGSRLLETAAAEARRQGARSLVAQSDPQTDPEGVAFLERKGFVRTEVLTTFEAPTERFVAHICTLRDRLRRANRIPPGARVVPLRDAPIAEAARLHAEHLAGTPRAVAERFDDLLVRDDGGYHVVLMVGDEVLGLVLARTAEGIMTVESEVLAPSGRAAAGNRWASALLLAEVYDQAVARGARVTRFSCTSGNHHTRRLAQRAGGTAVREQFVHVLALNEQPRANEASDGGSGGAVDPV